MGFITEGEQVKAKEVLENGRVSVDDTLIDILFRFNVRNIPTSRAEFHSLFLRIAKCEFITKPSVLVKAFKEGMLDAHPAVWSDLDATTIRTIYGRLDPTPEKVVAVLHPSPDYTPLTPQRDRVFEFLRRYVRRLTREKVSLFLQFVTGSSLLLVSKVEVAFTNLSGIQRRPIAHTCTDRIDVSTEYESFAAFAKEIGSILVKEECFQYTAI